MADPNQTTRLIIQLGDGQETEAFAHTCGANSWGVTLTNNLGENTVLDCTDPLGVPAAISRHLERQDTGATISGTIATTSWPTWRAWADDANKKNIRILIDESLADKGGYWGLPAYLSEFSLTKEGAGVVQFTGTISGAGRRVWTDAT